MANHRFYSSRPVWSFKTARFVVALYLTREENYRYDGDDEDGETQAAIDNGDLVAFNSRVVVELDGELVGEDYLGGSVYKADDVAAFYTAHRGRDPMDRNSSIMRAKRGGNACICHYFPSMVATAIEEARDKIRDMRPVPYIRESAR